MLQTQRTITKITPDAIPVQSQAKLRIAVYCRVSTDSKEQEHSFIAQVKYYTELIEKLEDSILVDMYADEGISGRSTTKRDDFNRLIADCKKGKIDRIITKSVSRFSRNTVDCLQIVRMLSQLGITILFEKEHIDTAYMTSEVILALSGTQAQDESISHGNNMRWSYANAMKSGNFLGNVATYGYTLIDRGTEIINEEEAKVVRLIKDLYLSGMGLQKIANYLNIHGIMRRSGKPWNAMAVRYVLTNERYVGDALLQKTISTYEYPPRKIPNRGQQPQYYVENCLPAIFTKEERSAILALMEQRGIRGRITGGHALSKLLRCSECGHLYRRVVTPKDILWRCAYRSGGKTDCTIYTLREEDVCEAFITAIYKLRLGKDKILMPMIEQLEAMQSKVNGTTVKISTIDKEIAVLSRQNLVIAELLNQGILEPSDFATQNNELSQKIFQLRNKRRELLAVNETDDMLNSLRELADMLEDMESEMSNYDEDIVRAIIKNATVVSDTELKIHLHGGLTVTEYLPKYYSRRCANQ